MMKTNEDSRVTFPTLLVLLGIGIISLFAQSTTDTSGRSLLDVSDSSVAVTNEVDVTGQIGVTGSVTTASGFSLTVTNQVDVSNSTNLQLGAGTDLIGDIKLQDESGDQIEWADTGNNAFRVNIVNDDVGIGGGVQYIEDAVVPGSPTGAVTLVERDDALSALSEAEGDWVHLRANANGAVWAQLWGTNTALSIQSGTWTVQPGDTANTVGWLVNATNVTGYALAANQLADGHNVTVDNAAGGSAVNIQDGGNTITVDGTVTADAGSGTFTVDLGANNDVHGTVAHDSADSGNPVKVGGKAFTTLPSAVAANDRVDQSMTTQGGALAAGTDGTTPRNVAVNSSGQLEVDISAQQGAALDVSGATVTTTPAVTGGGTEAAAQRVTIANDSTGVVSVDDNAGSLTIDGTVTANAGSGTFTVDLGANNDVQGDVAHDSADSGNPLKIGSKAKEMDGTDPGSVAENDRADALSDLNGRLLVNQMHPNHWSYTTNFSSAQTDTELKAAPGSGLHLYITDIVVSIGGTAGNVQFVKNTSSSTNVIEKIYFSVNGGAALHFETPIRIPDNVNFGVTSATVTDHSVLVNGYTAP